MLLLLLILAQATYAINPIGHTSRGVGHRSLSEFQQLVHPALQSPRQDGSYGCLGNNNLHDQAILRTKTQYSAWVSGVRQRSHLSFQTKQCLKLRGGLSSDPVGAQQAQNEEVKQAGDDKGTEDPTSAEEWKPMCRICYEDDSEDLFAPCYCSGSMGYVHRECLRKWRSVKIGERGFTHCTMCEFEYCIREGAQSPPDHAWYRFVRNMAGGECAVVSTILCLVVALGGESLERSGFDPTLLAKAWKGMHGGPESGENGGTEAQTSPVPESMLPEPSPEQQILRRLQHSWIVFGSVTGVGVLSPFTTGANSGVKLLRQFVAYILDEAEVRQAVTSVWVWWIVYAACEVVFIHLHMYPKALLSTLLLYAGVAIASLPLQWAMQLYVFVRGQPALDDVMSLEEAKNIHSQPKALEDQKTEID
mmetsp:Transcript_46792/g.73246  ORF Transcript_46792/g.73246 Transcript_46792/m.73246 type:complete len:419 (+) Transcript_46792:343-1599(+)